MRISSPGDVGRLVRAERLRRRMSQQDLAIAAAVSRRWLIDLEAGKPRAEIGLVLAVMNALGLALHVDSAATPSLEDVTVPSATVDLDAHLDRLAEPD